MVDSIVPTSPVTNFLNELASGLELIGLVKSTAKKVDRKQGKFRIKGLPLLGGESR